MLVLQFKEGIPSQPDVAVYRIYDSSDNTEGHGVFVDSSKNMHVVGPAVDSGQTNMLTMKLAANDSITWQRFLGSAGATPSQARSVDVDSSNNVYTVGNSFVGASSSSDIVVAKYNSSGVLQWQRRAGDTTNSEVAGGTLDSSGNIIAVGYVLPSQINTVVVKYDSSGTHQWTQELTAGGINLNPMGGGVVTDSSGNIYFVAHLNTSGIVLFKLNSSGALQWQTRIAGASTVSLFTGTPSLSIDSSGNLYLAGYYYNTFPGDGFIMKLDSSGTIVWQRYLGHPSRPDYGVASQVDASGNVYFLSTAYTGSGSKFEAVVAKYNSTGVLQWQQKWAHVTSPTISPYGFQLSGDSLYVTGTTPSDAMVFRSPTDGTGSGTYGSYTYGASTLTDSAGSLTQTTTTHTTTTTSVTTAATTLTDSAGDRLVTVS